jgi:biopolymer transport protein ExbD
MINKFDWDSKPELNITPLVDVMLVLLAVLMVTTPTIIYEEKIILPSGSKTKVLEKIQIVEISIDKNKIIRVNKIKYDFDAFADNFMLSSRTLSKNSTVIIYGNKTLLYNDIMYILKSVKEAGFSNVSLASNG